MPHEHNRPNICFVALNTYSLLNRQEEVRFVGGSEAQQVLIGRELERRGYRVSFIVENHGQRDGEVIDGIRIVTAYRPSRGLRFVRFVHPRLTGLWSALKRANADIYYQRTAEFTTGVVAAFCRCHRRHFFFAVGSDYHCMPDLPNLRTWRERVLYRYGLQRATRIIAQTEKQREMLIRYYGVDSVVISNCGPEPESKDDDDRTRLLSAPRHIVWLGRVSSEKRLDMLLDLAKECPEFIFDIVGKAHSPTDYSRRIEQRAATLPNVILHGEVPRAEIDVFYRQACAVVCTSPVEGFPNVFVEAWSFGVPVVSTFDPDGVIQREGLGVVAHDVAGMAEGIRHLITDESSWLRASQAARRHFLADHSIDSFMARFQPILDKPWTRRPK